MPSHALVYAAVLGARALIYALVYAAALRTGPVFGAKQRFCRLAYQEPYQLRSATGLPRDGSELSSEFTCRHAVRETWRSFLLRRI